MTATSDVAYRMNADWTEMIHLEGREFIASTREPTGPWLQKYVPADELRVTSPIAEAVREVRVFEMEHRVIRADGTVGWTFSRAIPVFDANGTVEGWFGAASDVTARKEAEQEQSRAAGCNGHLINPSTCRTWRSC